MALHAPLVSRQFRSVGQSQSHTYGNDDSNLSPNRSHSGLFSYAKNVTINGGSFSNVGGSSISIAQNKHGEKLEQNLDALGLIPDLRVCRPEDLSLKRQLYKGRGYRLHPGRTDGNTVAVKVFVGLRAKELCLKAVKLHRKLMHPSFFQMIAGPPRDSESPFIVFAGDYERTLESRLSLALKKDIRESVILGLQTVISGSEGLDYLQDLGYPLSTAGSEHLVLVIDNNGEIVVDFDPEVAWDPEASRRLDPSDDPETERGLELFNELIQKTFYAPCRSHYIGQRAYFGGATSDEDDDDELSQSGIEEVENVTAQSLRDGLELAEPALHTQKKSKSTTGHRRELVWKSQMAQAASLEQISRKTRDYLENFRRTPVLNRRRGRPIANITHPCPGYQRTEIMLTSDIERSAIVAHSEPIPGEICPVCKKVVENVRDTRMPISHTAVPSPLDLPHYAHSGRIHINDFSHLPPSPSSSSIQQFLRTTIGPTNSQPSPLRRSSKDNVQAQSSPNVAHSLLRGDLEGWNLEDEATAEAIRKLDNMPIWKDARARVSVGSLGPPSSSSRPRTPASELGSQWDGINASGSGRSKRGSGYVKESSFGKDNGDYTVLDVVEPSVAATSSDKQPRGSTSSTTYASPPSSRDLASMSAATSGPSVSTDSGRHSSHKGRRNGASSNISSIHSNDATHAAFNGDANEENVVPPVPPLPKDLSSFTSSNFAFPTIPPNDKLFNNDRLPVLKTPSKKWSFSSALNLKLSGSPSSSSQKLSSFPLSPRVVKFGQHIRQSTSKEPPTSSSPGQAPWSLNQPDAMSSAGSFASLSSVGSVRTSGPPSPEPLSPSSSIRRGRTRRLSPSSIPFFRRSSSQSMQVPPSSGPSRTPSPPFPDPFLANQSYVKQSMSQSQDYNFVSALTPGASHKKSSMHNSGLPSLLKSSSRRSQHSEAKAAAKELQRAKDAARDSEKERIEHQTERQKKDEDRSESRISVILNRKRGKPLSSADPRKPISPVNLPPIQMSALEPVTAQRMAKLKSNANPVSSLSNRASTSSSSSRLTSQTVSSMHKQSDISLRRRNQLPTIAGSNSGLPKETPTLKIPRISSRSSLVESPPLKNSTLSLGARRASNLIVTSSTDSSCKDLRYNEFGVIENEDGMPLSRP